MPANNRSLAAIAAVLLTSGVLSACSVAGGAEGESDNVIVVGYQSKTINTVTAGTLLRELGYFEKGLEDLGDYEVEWQDYDTGAPITAQMLAGKIDIGSMGDYPLLINGSRAGTDDSGTSMIAVTGYNPHGALNGVVVDQDSDVTQLSDLEGASISASVGSAGHGTLVQALEKEGIDPTDDVSVENQDPSVGAAALKGGSVDAVSQFVAWPGLLAFRDDARLVYDGGQLDLPTLHGTVVRNEFADQQGEIVDAFLKAQIDATNALHEQPIEASEIVAEKTGLPAEVVYLYNGRNGVSTFDTTIKPDQVAALEHDVPFLKSIGVLTDPVDVGEFVDDALIKEAFGAEYDAAVGSAENPAAITGRDDVCGEKITDPALAGEIWVDGEPDTQPVASPECLLRNVNAVEADGDQLRAAYLPDAVTGTRWFADRMVWLQDGQELLPFATEESAQQYSADHPGAEPRTWEQALETAG